MAIRKKRRHIVRSILRHMPKTRWKLRTLLWKHKQKEYERLASGIAVDDQTVIFEAFGGRQYACSPKAIYRAMCKDPRFDEWTFVWAFGASRIEELAALPELERATCVVFGSKEHLKTLAKAKFWINNNRVYEHVYPKPEQVYVQCWHGTPLKQLGFDVAQEKGGALNSALELAKRFRIDSEKWTYLLSPSEYTSKHLADAFGLPQEKRAQVILQEGYPRNDSIVTTLQSHDAAKKIAALKEELGIPQDKKVLLLAPTWRDDQYDSSSGYVAKLPVDMDALQKQLGSEWIVLLRMHYYISNKIDLTPWHGFAFDVSSAPDINKLYVVADALCTDYSSVFFDYANTGRPLIFLWPDREHYENDLHGFYCNPDALPGPKCNNTKDLIEAVQTLDLWNERYGNDYKEFREKFCPMDDGHASERVIAHLLQPKTS